MDSATTTAPMDSSSCNKRWWRVKHRRTFVPGKCRVVTHERARIGQLLNKTRVVYRCASDDDRDRTLLARTVFVEESLRCNDDDYNREEDGVRHRCSDPRNRCDEQPHACDYTLHSITRRRRPTVLKCISMYFAYFHDIKNVFRIDPTSTMVTSGGGGGGDGDNEPFGVFLDSHTANLYLYCNEYDLDKWLIVAEGIPDHRLIVNDTFVPLNDGGDDENSCGGGHGSSTDRRVFSILACIMNVERLVYDSLKDVSVEKTLAELTFNDDDDAKNGYGCEIRRRRQRRYDEDLNDTMENAAAAEATMTTMMTTKTTTVNHHSAALSSFRRFRTTRSDHRDIDCFL